MMFLVLFCCFRYFSVVFGTLLLCLVHLLTYCIVFGTFFSVLWSIAVMFSVVFGSFRLFSVVFGSFRLFSVFLWTE